MKCERCGEALKPYVSIAGFACFDRCACGDCLGYAVDKCADRPNGHLDWEHLKRALRGRLPDVACTASPDTQNT